LPYPPLSKARIPRDHDKSKSICRFALPPLIFTRLLRGGLENNLRAEAIFWHNGDQFLWNGRRWLPVAFRQDFKPGRDEVRVTATPRQKGDICVRELTSKLAYSAAQIGRHGYHKVFG